MLRQRAEVPESWKLGQVADAARGEHTDRVDSALIHVQEPATRTQARIEGRFKLARGEPVSSLSRCCLCQALQISHRLEVPATPAVLHVSRSRCSATNRSANQTANQRLTVGNLIGPELSGQQICD